MHILDSINPLFHALDTYKNVEPIVSKTLVHQSPITRPIFVIGSPRSGTTLIGNCLNMSDDLGGGEESLLLLDMWRIYSDLHQGNNKRNYSPISKYISGKDLIINIKSFADSIFSSALQKKQRYIDHTPWYALIIRFIHSLYPDAIFIHVIRDGKEVVDSLEKSYNNGFLWAGEILKERALIWVKSITSVQNYVNGRHDVFYKEIHYEDLWDNPASMLKTIADFCCVDYHAGMLRQLCVPHATCNEQADIIGYYNNNGDVLFNRRQLHDKAYGFNKVTFNEVAGELQTALGYDL